MEYYDYTPDLNPLDDEEERKRREREAIAARMEQEALSNPIGPVEPSFGSVMGQVFNKRLGAAQDRLNQVGDVFANPAAAIQQRMLNEQQQAAQEEAANTEVQTQTTKHYADGSQEHTVKTQIPAGQPAATPTAVTAPMGPIAPNSPEAHAQTEQFAQAMARAQQQQPQARAGLTTPIANMPANLPAQGPIPPEAANQAPVMAKLPQPGPAVQVAGATQMPPAPAAPGASLAQMGQAAKAQAPVTAPAPAAPPAAPAQPAWVQAANDAGTDLTKLFDVAAKHPESRDMIQAKMELALQNKTKEDAAKKLFADAAAGDLKAINKIQQSIKPETGKAKEEITVGDYVKAILYDRLGLHELSKDVQNKIIGKETKFGQVTLGGANWQVETDPAGNIIRAKDDEGNFATESTLNKLRAGGVKAGTHATQFTGGIHTVPNAAGTGVDLVMPTQNAISGQAGFTYASGPNQGKPYTGSATPQPQSVGTSFQKALDKAMIDFRTAPSTAGAKAAMDKAYVLDPGDGSVIRAVQANINANAPDIFNQIKNYSPSGNVSEQLPGAPRAQVESVQRDIDSIQRELKQKPGAGTTPEQQAQRRAILEKELATRQDWLSKNGGGATAAAPAAGTSLAQQESNVKIGQAVSEARLKPPATKQGEIEAQNISNQNTANEAYGMIQPVADLIKQSTGSTIGTKVDKLAGLFGVGTKGAQAIAQLDVLSYPFKYSIPRFEGPQSDRDTAAYEKAAGDFANSEKPIAVRLAALQAMTFMLKKYDKAGNNDWTFGGNNPAQAGTAQPGTTSSGNKFKRVQ